MKFAGKWMELENVILSKTLNTNGLSVVPVQFKIKADFGVGEWLSPSLNPNTFVKGKINKTFNLEKQNHTPRKHHQHHHQQHQQQQQQQQQPPPPIPANGQQDSSQNEVRNLPQYVSNELLEEAFSVFGQVERAVVIVDDGRRPSGKGIVEFSGKPAARKALDRCSEGSFLLTTFPRPVTVEPMDQLDDDEGLPEKLVIKNQQFHKEREQPPRFAQPGSFEYEYSMRWKALVERKKQQQDQVDRNIKEAREKMEMEMEVARHEHQVMLMR
ncbi:hypothetical protein STEG23_004344 [Scotinomys teguina]